MTLAPAAFDESQLGRAAAQGRQDGLLGQRRNIVLEGPGAELPAGPTRAILEAALRQCYAAGHRHGSDVRRENAIRRRRAEPPILSLLPGNAELPDARLLAGPASWHRRPKAQPTP